LKTAGLFAGIGGLERGFELAGFETAMVAEIDRHCQDVLRTRFPGADVAGDVEDVSRLPECDAILSGFPCQPYSPVGLTTGHGVGQWHIDQIFRLLDSRRRKPAHIVLENVPFLVHLAQGRTLRHVLDGLEERGYLWAYRMIDTSAFGLPQRRRRWILVASRTGDPASMLLAQDVVPTPPQRVTANGFYWTEGNRGIGWADNAVPPLKCGSNWGIASPPAIWARSSGTIWVPRIVGAEKLQGFDPGWTEVESTEFGRGSRARWRMVGNAVSVPLAQWVAERILADPDEDIEAVKLAAADPLPRAAFYDGDTRYRSGAGFYPVARPMPPLMGYLNRQVEFLSVRATRGFRIRYQKSPLVKNHSFIAALRAHEKAQAG